MSCIKNWNVWIENSLMLSSGTSSFLWVRNSKAFKMIKNSGSHSNLFLLVLVLEGCSTEDFSHLMHSTKSWYIRNISHFATIAFLLFQQFKCYFVLKLNAFDAMKNICSYRNMNSQEVVSSKNSDETAKSICLSVCLSLI